MEHTDLKELVDLYAKLIIGTFTFIGPSFTLLISLFTKQLEQTKNVTKDRIHEMLRIEEEPENFGNELRKQLKTDRKRQLLLKPKRQVIRLFGTLLVALALIAFYYFQHTHFWLQKIVWVRRATLIVSGLSYSYCLYVLWQIFCVVINAKIGEERDHSRKRSTPLIVQKQVNHE